MLVYYLKANQPHITKIWFTSLAVVEDSTETTRTSWKDVCVLISMILVLVLNKLVLPVMALVEQIKQHLAKRSLRRFLIYQILDYKTILHLSENEIMSIKFFRICKESMISLENLEIEKWYEGEDTVPVTRISHHLIPLSSSRIGPKLTSEAESYVDLQPISLCDLVSLVDIASGDVINIDFIQSSAIINLHTQLFYYYLVHKVFISLNECRIRKAKTWQYSYFWLPNLHYLFQI